MAKIILLITLLFSGSSLFASCVTGSSQTGCVHYFFKTDGNTDAATNNPSPDSISWMQQHFAITLAYAPYWDSRLSWMSRAWLYRDSSSLYRGSAITIAHPEWILRNAYGQPLYLNWNCGLGVCAQYAADYSSPSFRRWWIDSLKKDLAKGYAGVFVDDVNLVINLSNGWNQDAPVDPQTNEPITLNKWQSDFSDFLAQLRSELPKIQIAHNSLWYAGDPTTNAYIRRQVQSANILNIERGFADTGLVGDNGFWSIQNLWRYIDHAHQYGASVIAQQYYVDNEFSLACYHMTNMGTDLFSVDGMVPAKWQSSYDIDLGSATGVRWIWNGLTRRDFANGIALVNLPKQPARTVQLDGQYVTSSGAVVTSITLAARQGVVLRRYGRSTSQVKTSFAGDHVLVNKESRLNLDVANWSMAPNAQLLQWNPTGSTTQTWTFLEENGYYRLKNAATGLYLTAGSNGITATQQRLNTANARQLWKVAVAKDGFSLATKDRGDMLANPGSSHKAGIGMITWVPLNLNDQVWFIQ